MTELPPLAVRALTEADADRVVDLDELVFSEPPYSPETRALLSPITELGVGRGIGVFDGEELAGVGALGTMAMTVPGGTVPLAAVLLIGVSPVYRRRGVMTTIMRRQLHTLHETGAEPLAGLTASEAAIYGRFGFGTAHYFALLTVPREQSALRPVPGTGDVRLRLVPTAGSGELCEPIVARQAGRRAGTMTPRPAHWARLAVADPEQWREGRSVLRTILAERDATPVGFARYATKSDYGPSGLPAGVTDVSEIYADDAAAYAALVQYLCDIDLTATTRFRRQPADSPLRYLLRDFRAAHMQVRDGLYLRLVDVDRALAARKYSAPVNVVLEVTDAFCPWNAGRWQLTGDEKTAACVRSDAPADLVLDVHELAAAYLGGNTLAALGQAGLVTEHRPGALTDASRAFATDLAPHLPWGI